MKFYPQVPSSLQDKILECTDQLLVLRTPAAFWSREEFVIIKPDQLILTGSLKEIAHTDIHPLTKHHRAVRYVKNHEESSSTYYVSVTNGKKWIKFAREMRSSDHEWIILRINELLGKRLRDICPNCGAMLKASQVDFIAGTMACGSCSWLCKLLHLSSDDDATDPKLSQLQSSNSLILEKKSGEDDEFQVLLDPPPAITVLRASTNILRLKIRPHRLKAIGCGAVLLLLLMIPVAMLVNVRFPDNLVGGALGIGIISLISMLFYNPLFGVTLINVDRQSNVFSYSQGFISRRTTLTPKTKLILSPQERHPMNGEVIEKINHDEAIRVRLYLFNPEKSLNLELVPNQSSTSKHWLKKVLQLYLVEAHTPRSLLPVIPSLVESCTSTVPNQEHEIPLNASVPDLSPIPGNCPNCDAVITPSMINIDTRKASCPRTLSCGWGSADDQQQPLISIHKSPRMKRLLRLVEDYLILKMK